MSDENEIIVDHIRPTRCPECKEAFNFHYQLKRADLNTKPLWVDMRCKWCDADLSVDVSQYRTFVMHRNSSNPQANAISNGFALPTEIPAQTHADKTSDPQ